MKRCVLLLVVTICFSANMAQAFIYENVERNDPACKKAMRLVIEKFGKSDEVLQVSSNSISAIYRKKRLHFNFEIVGTTCRVTSSDF